MNCTVVPFGRPATKDIALMAVAAMATLVLSREFFLAPLILMPDQAMIAQAAIRFREGLGLTLLSLTADLTRPAATQLIYFPPLFPLVLGALNYAGVSLQTAIKLLNGGALVAGIFGWIALAGTYLPSMLSRILFAALLVAACGALVPIGGTADYLMWAGTAWWLTWLLRFVEPSADRPLKYALASRVAVMIAILVGVRWAAAELVPATGCVILAQRLRYWRWTRIAAGLVATCILPTTFYIVVTAINTKLNGLGGTVLEFLQPTLAWSYLLTTYPLEALTTIPLAISPVLFRLIRAAGWTIDQWQALTLRVSGMIGLVLFAFTLRKRHSPGDGADQVFLSNLIVVLALHVLFLSYMSVRYAIPNYDWIYLAEARYYRPFFPVCALLWLCYCGRTHWRGRVAAVAVGVILVGVIYAIQAYARSSPSAGLHVESVNELLDRIRQIPISERPQVLFDIDTSDYVLLARPDLSTYRYPRPDETDRMHTSRAVDLWLVRRTRQTTNFVTDPDYDNGAFKALAKKFEPRLVWTSSQGEYELFHAIVVP